MEFTGTVLGYMDSPWVYEGVLGWPRSRQTGRATGGSRARKEVERAEERRRLKPATCIWVAIHSQPSSSLCLSNYILNH